MKKAICFGINNYSGNANSLSGAINDCLNWSIMLDETFGFETNIFLDQQVTRATFRKELTSLLTKSKTGDVLVVFYSGHGTNIGNGEAVNEGLFLYDDILLDTEIVAITDRYLSSNVSLTFIVDASFTGGAIHVSPLNKPKFAEMGQSVEGTNSFLKDTNLTCISGGKLGLLAYDTYYKNRWNGLFTRQAKRVIAANPAITYNQFVAKVERSEGFNLPHLNIFEPTVVRKPIWERIKNLLTLS